MGIITQEVEQKYLKAKAMISAKPPQLVPATGLISLPLGGAVQGHAVVDLHHVNTQMDAIEDCLEAIVKALKKLEDRK